MTMTLGTLQGHNNESVAVLGYDKVRVPAGEFDAFKLETAGQMGVTASARSRRVLRDVLVRPRSARYREEIGAVHGHAHLHH